MHANLQLGQGRRHKVSQEGCVEQLLAVLESEDLLLTAQWGEA